VTSLLTLLLSGCAPDTLVNELALCNRLRPEASAHEEALATYSAPDAVLVTGVRLLKGFEAGCAGKGD
jgi:hypothetical protein